MPGGDRTGPDGNGSLTGRGLGRCSGSDAPGRGSNVSPRRGLGRQANREGRGFRHVFKVTGKTLVEVQGEKEESAPPSGRGFGRGRCGGSKSTASSEWYGSRKRPGPFAPCEPEGQDGR